MSMRKYARRMSGVVFDLRVIVGLCGIILSVVAHELLHIMMHMGEIESVHLLPDSRTIVEVIFMPTTSYDLVAEEAVAYGVTMFTMILTAKLIGDINDNRDEETPLRVVLEKDFNDCYTPEDADEASLHLCRILGIEPVA